MPIPPLTSEGYLPPYERQTLRNNSSPYQCSSVELVHSFGTSEARIKILRGFFDLRRNLRDAGFPANCYQWINGSFVTNKESILNASPNDIDVITLYLPPGPDFNSYVSAKHRHVVDPRECQNLFSTDHYVIDLSDQSSVVKSITYWFSLFSHTREDVRKGMLQINLGNLDEDSEAVKLIDNWEPDAGEVEIS